MDAEQRVQRRVGIGVPVYNGGQFVRTALDSVLAQTFRDFDIIISDNGSTDSTEAICLEYASRDARIKYHRNTKNMGVVWNFNHVFELSSTQYFVWLSDDDVLAPTYIERCVEILDRDPSIIVSFSAIGEIDEHGKLLGRRERTVVLDSGNPTERFRNAICLNHRCEPSYGVMRSEVLRRTPLYGAYADYDRVFLAELGLHGRLYEIPEILFFEREHVKRSTNACLSRLQMTVWVDPSRAGQIVFPHFRQFREFLIAIKRAPITWLQRMQCYLEMVRWAAVNWKRMLGDVKVAGRESFIWLGSHLNGAPSSAAVLARLNVQRSRTSGQWFLPQELELLRVLVSRIVPSDPVGPGALEAGAVGKIESEVASSSRAQYLYGRGFLSLNEWANRRGKCDFVHLTRDEQVHLLQHIDHLRQLLSKNVSPYKKALRKMAVLYYKWKGLYPAVELFPMLVRDVVRIFYTSAITWNWLGYDGPPMPLGYPDLWESRQKVEAPATMPVAES